MEALDGVTDLYLVPHDSLNYLPFALLPVGSGDDHLLVEDFTLRVDRSSVTKLKFTNSTTGKIGVEYKDEWGTIFGVNDTTNLNELDMGDEMANIAQSLVVGPRFSLSLFGVVGAYFQAGGAEKFNVNLAEPDWDANMNTGYEMSVAAYYDIWFDYGEKTKSWSDLYNIWSGPTTFEIISGDDQEMVTYEANKIESLEEPLKVVVKDSYGNPLKNVNVHFDVKKGGGFVQDSDVVTDGNGYAETVWTLGTESEDQIVEATIKNANGAMIGNSPLEFNATLIDLSGEWVFETTSSNCPEYLQFKFYFIPDSKTINVTEGGSELITSTYFDFDVEERYLIIHVTTEEEFSYICEVNDYSYNTTEKGDGVASGYYSNGEFTGTLSVSFTELPENPCVNNYSCSDTFRIYRESL